MVKRNIYNCIIILVVIVLCLTSCKSVPKSTINNYSISTNFDLQLNGASINYIDNITDVAEFELRIIFNSNIAFGLEMGLIDNFSQREYEIKNGDEYSRDEIFEISLPCTNNEFKESVIKIRVDKIESSSHDLIFFIKNREKIVGNSIRGYDFIRLQVNCSDDNEFNFGDEISFCSKKQKNIFLELEPIVKKKEKTIDCQLQFNIEKIYDGDKFIAEYDNNKENSIDFIIMVLENNKLLNINDTNSFLYGKTTIKDSGNLNFKANSLTNKKEDVVFLLIPYPLLNVKKSERYKMIAYNSICYYYFKFDESIELLTEG